MREPKTEAGRMLLRRVGPDTYRRLERAATGWCPFRITSFAFEGREIMLDWFNVPGLHAVSRGAHGVCLKYQGMCIPWQDAVLTLVWGPAVLQRFRSGCVRRISLDSKEPNRVG